MTSCVQGASAHCLVNVSKTEYVNNVINVFNVIKGPNSFINTQIYIDNSEWDTTPQAKAGEPSCQPPRTRSSAQWAGWRYTRHGLDGVRR